MWLLPDRTECLVFFSLLFLTVAPLACGRNRQEEAKEKKRLDSIAEVYQGAGETELEAKRKTRELLETLEQRVNPSRPRKVALIVGTFSRRQQAYPGTTKIMKILDENRSF